MDLDFDKEIDAILRKAHRDGPVLIGDFAGSRHLDADEISAFAENAMPENSRSLYSAHMAECDRCRKILSNLLVMNAEAVPAAPPHLGAITIAERAVPWYRRLFLFPNLSYVMGGLVLIFGGFLAFTVVQNSNMGGSDAISQATEVPTTQGGPFFDAEPSYGNENTSANMAANIAVPSTNSASSNASTNSAAPTMLQKNALEARGGRDENNFVADGTATTDVTVTGEVPSAAAGAPAPPPSTSATQPRAREADAPKAKAEDKAVSGFAVQDSKKTDSELKRQYPATASPTQSGPMRNNERQYNRQLENLDSAERSKRMAGRRDEDSSGRKTVGGKIFERKQGVWYDSNYQGRPTINVRRGTDEFNRLDGGLRSIANSMSGTVVVVWGAKAYRIQ
jgi:hypothetical protein